MMIELARKARHDGANLLKPVNVKNSDVAAGIDHGVRFYRDWLIKRILRSAVGQENIYRLRRIFFKLRHPAEYRLARKRFDILFFCELPSRWQNIQLVVEELSRRRSDLRLGIVFTCSRKNIIPDCLSLPNVATIAHVGMAILYLFDARILYAPAIGLPPSIMPPRARVIYAAMTMLSPDGFFSDYTFPGYDYILCGGAHQLEYFRSLASRQPRVGESFLPLPAGYPKLDLMLASHSTDRHPRDRSVTTVVYAPTHIAYLRLYGEAVINALLADGYRVIFRPHPGSIHRDRDVINRIRQNHGSDGNFVVDTNPDYTESYSSADLMVTDLSGTGFTFSFSFSKPCIFFSPSAEQERGMRGIQYESRHRIGALVRDIDELLQKTSELCKRNMDREIEQFRDETVFNVGKSAAYIVGCLEDILAGRERPEWLRL